MSEWTEAERAALKKLIAGADADPSFTSQEREIVDQLIGAARTLLMLGRLAKWAIFILTALAGGIAAWEKIRGSAGW